MQLASFSADDLSTLRAAYGKFQFVPESVLPRLRALFADCSPAALEQLAKGKIKFVSKLAVNAQVRRRAQFAPAAAGATTIKAYPMNAKGTAAARRDRKARAIENAVFADESAF